MARTLSTRERNLAAILVLVGIATVWYAFRSDDAQKASEAKAAAAKKAAKLDEPPRVRMDLLARAAEDTLGSGRDLFKYAPRPPSKAEVARLRREAEEARKAEEARLAALKKQQEEEAERQRQIAELHKGDPPPPPPKPQPPAVTLQYLGYLGPKEGKIAVFMDGQDMMLARVGEVLKQDFKVVDIKYDTVVMGYTKQEFQSETREIPISRR